MSVRWMGLACALAVGCGDEASVGADASTTGGADGGVAADAAPQPMSWAVETIEGGDNNTGWQPSTVVAPNGTIGVAYLRKKDDLGECMIQGSSLGTNARWDVMYSQSTGGAFSTPELVATVELLSATGIALAFDPASQPAIVYMGGAPANLRCGGSDLLMSRKMGGGWTVTTVDGNGNATPLFMEDATACMVAQNVCNSGDTVGEWPAITFVGNDPLIAYRDIHFGFAMNDFDKSDVELSWNGRSTLDASWGGGTFTSVLVDGMGRPQLVHHNKYPEKRDRGSGIFVATYAGGAWTRQKISSELVVGYKLGFAAHGAKLGVAVHAQDAQKLRYIESADGVTWGAEEVVDQNGNTGLSPSLAFDPAGAPAIAYHSCGPFVPGQQDCPQDRDALKLASKASGRWRTIDVETSRGGVDGVFVTLVYGPDGYPVIVYQASYYDPMTNTVNRHLKVARGRP